jgi:hypothetical protein
MQTCKYVLWPTLADTGAYNAAIHNMAIGWPRPHSYLGLAGPTACGLAHSFFRYEAFSTKRLRRDKMSTASSGHSDIFYS